MITDAEQRWSHRRTRWARPDRELYDPDRYGVTELDDDATAKTFVEEHHYAGSYVAAQLRYGLFDLKPPDREGPVLAGVAVLSVPVSKYTLPRVFPHLEPNAEAMELGRLILLDGVGFNGESAFLAEVFRLACKKGVRGLVMFCDPVPRTTLSGRLVLRGHVGQVYQAVGARYVADTKASTLVLLPDGTVLNRRAIQKIRAQEPGHRGAEQRLVRFGAPPLAAGEDPARWLPGALKAAQVRRLWHTGNLEYAMIVGTNERDRAKVTIALPGRPYLRWQEPLFDLSAGQADD